MFCFGFISYNILHFFLHSAEDPPFSNNVPYEQVLQPQAKLKQSYISIGLGTGFLTCLMVEPGSVGLKGACLP